MSSRTFTWNAYETQLASDLSEGQTSATVLNADNLTAPVYLVIDPEDVTLREWVKVTAITGNTFDTIERGLAGSVGLPGVGVAHLSGASVRVVYTKQVQDDLFFDIEALEGDTGTIIVDLAEHISNEVDPHAAAGYVKDNEKTPFLRLDGTSVVTADIPMAGFILSGLSDPIAAQDAATKQYVDALIDGTLKEPLVLQEVLTVGNIQALTNDLTFKDAGGNILFRWDESDDRWEFLKALDMQDRFLQNPGTPTASSHVGDRAYNDGRYLKIAANAVSASKWSTARSLTTTLSGDVTGSASMSVDGAANRTVTVSASVKNHLKLTGGVLTGSLTLPAGLDSNTSLRFSGQGTKDGMWGAGQETSFGFDGSRLFSVFGSSSGQAAHVEVRGRSLVPLSLVRSQSGMTESSLMMRFTAGNQSEVTLSLRALRWLADNHN